jgi:Na+/proline symporter
MGSMLYAVGVILQVVLGLTDQQMVLAVIVVGVLTTFYTVVGGLEAVVWADAALGVILVGSMLTILTLAVGRIDGGAATVWTLGLEHGKFDMFDVRFDPTVNNNFYSACAYGLFVYLAAHATAQTSVQRYQSMPSLAAVRRSLVVKGLTIAAGCLVFFVAGSVLFAFYHQPGQAGFPDLPRQDQLLTHFVMTEIPFPGLTGLLLTGLFAAAMSSIDGGINSLTALVACDWLAERRLNVGGSRILGLVIGAGVIGAALVVPYLASNVFDIIIKIAGALLGPLLGLFLLGMFVPRANSSGAAFGLLGGLVCLLLATQTALSHWWYGAVTCVPTVAVGALASLAFPAPPAEKVQGLLAWMPREAVSPPAEEPLAVT